MSSTSKPSAVTKREKYAARKKLKSKFSIYLNVALTLTNSHKIAAASISSVVVAAIVYGTGALNLRTACPPLTAICVNGAGTSSFEQLEFDGWNRAIGLNGGKAKMKDLTAKH